MTSLKNCKIKLECKKISSSTCAWLKMSLHRIWRKVSFLFLKSICLATSKRSTVKSSIKFTIKNSSNLLRDRKQSSSGTESKMQIAAKMTSSLIRCWLLTNWNSKSFWRILELWNSTCTKLFPDKRMPNQWKPSKKLGFWRIWASKNLIFYLKCSTNLPK